MASDSTFAGPGAGVILYAPASDLVQTERVRPNPDYKADRPAKLPKPRRRKALEHPALELYGGYDKFLVRTALIRAEGYDATKAVQISSPADVAQLCRHLVYADNEYLVTVALDRGNKLRAINEAGIGPADHVAFTAMQILKVAVLTSASALVMVHNHPSGNPMPSGDDMRATQAVRKAADCVGLDVLDHVIVASEGWYSIASGEEIGRVRWTP